MKEIILKKRYPHSREEDIIDAFMRGYEIGKEQEHRWWSAFCANCKTENSSEKPNNCEVKNYCDDCLYTDTCDSKEFFYACTSKATISKMEQVEDEPQTEDADCDKCIWSVCKREVKDEPQLTPNYCGTCKHREVPCGDLPCDVCHGYSNYEPKDEPTISILEQVEDETRLTAKCLNCANGSSYKCSKCNGEMYYKYDKDEPQTCSVNGRPYDCGNCEYFKCTADEPQTERSE